MAMEHAISNRFFDGVNASVVFRRAGLDGLCSTGRKVSSLGSQE
jgi:hypothetical protein